MNHCSVVYGLFQKKCKEKPELRRDISVISQNYYVSAIALRQEMNFLSSVIGEMLQKEIRSTSDRCSKH